MSLKNVQGLVSFVESASGGSFTAAASRLGVTPAAVGKNVARLEGELGVRLFNRTTRRLSLTDEGQAFLAEAGDALRRLEDAVDNVTLAAREPAGRVRISCSTSFGRRFVLPLLSDLARRHPKLDLELVLDDRIVDMLAEGFDIAVRGGTLGDSSLVAKHVCRLYSVLVASPAYLRRHGVPASPADLERHRLLAVRLTSGARPWRFRKPSGRGFVEHPPAAQLWTSDPEAFLELACAGEGICQAGLMLAAPLLREGKLRLVLQGQYDNGDRQFVLCYPHRSLMSRRVRVVVDALGDGLAKQPDLHLSPGTLPAEWLAASDVRSGRSGGTRR
jgi:DNA-binding transcriptional LysR family regulator